jgi:hypothetical protein
MSSASIGSMSFAHITLNFTITLFKDGSYDVLQISSQALTFDTNYRHVI